MKQEEGKRDDKRGNTSMLLKPPTPPSQFMNNGFKYIPFSFPGHSSIIHQIDVSASVFLSLTLEALEMIGIASQLDMKDTFQLITGGKNIKIQFKLILPSKRLLNYRN